MTSALELLGAVLALVFWVSAAAIVVVGAKALSNYITSRSLNRKAEDRLRSLVRRLDEDREVADLEDLWQRPARPGRWVS